MYSRQFEQIDASRLTLSDLNTIRARGQEMQTRMIGDAIRAIRNRFGRG